MNSTSFQLNLCQTEFWDTKSIWYTERLKVSSCFRDTTLIWVPAGIFLLVARSELSGEDERKSRNIKEIPWSRFNRFRILLTLSLFFLKLSESSSYFCSIWFDLRRVVAGDEAATQEDASVSQAEEGKVLVISSLIAPLIQASCYLVLAIIYFLHRSRGIHTSGPVWFYLLFSVLSDIFEFYAVITATRAAIYNEIELVVKCMHFPILVLLFLFECHGDTPIIESNTAGIRPDSPELQASFFSHITLLWFNSFLIYGYKNKIEISNLWKTLERDRADELAPQLKKAWLSSKDQNRKDTYLASDGSHRPTNSSLKVLAKIFWPKLLLTSALKLLNDSLQFLTPMLLKLLLDDMSSDLPQWEGTLVAVLLFIIQTCQSLALVGYFYHTQLIGQQIQSMLVGSIYRKSLLLNSSSGSSSTGGEIINLMAVDSERFKTLILNLNLFWSAPYQVVGAIILLYYELGWAVFAGVGCMILLLPVNVYLANRIKLLQIDLMAAKDERVKQMTEVLSGIKVIKLYAWENSFISNLLNYRSKELEYLRTILNLDAMPTFLWRCSSFIVSAVTFAFYVSLDSENVLTAKKAFVSIALFNLLRDPLTTLPKLVSSLVLAMVSAKRLDKFLNSDELVEYVTRNEQAEAITIEGGTLAWSNEPRGHDEGNSTKIHPTITLRDIDLHVKKGSFVAVVGQVASGKSSLLSAILGDMYRISGRFNVCKSMSLAYVPQQAWIQNMTVRDNILFGSQYDERRYKSVLAACSLETDLETLAGGDEAEIGEKGINLSGGQKQRVSLARACYSDSDIVLLDDPLSALDSHVAKHVYEQVLSSSSGLLRGKTRVLATNTLFVLPHVDHIVVLREGKIVESGCYQELMSNSNGHLAEFMRQYGSSTKQDEEMAGCMVPGTVKENVASKVQVQCCRGETGTKSCRFAPETGQSLIGLETVETGGVSFTVYLRYFKAISLFWLIFVVVSFFAAASFGVGANLWLSVWSSDAEDAIKSKDIDLRQDRLIIYIVLGSLQCVLILLGSLGMCRGSVRASKNLHTNLLNRVMHSPMSFFDTTPMGRITNRFAKDIDVVDSGLPDTFRSWINGLLLVASTIFVICYSFPTFLLIILPMAAVYYLILRIFTVTTRQLTRLESNTRSSMYSHFSETLSGLSTIRAYSCVGRFIEISDKLTDQNQSCYYTNLIANQWLSFRLESFGNFITAFAALFSVYYRSVVGVSVAGLTISYSLSTTRTLGWFVRATSFLETNIVSVERIFEYMRNGQEDLWIKNKRPEENWPQEGAIKFENYSTRYRDETDLILRDLTLDIKPREKIGIVGRTGSGKSSLSLSLFRILESASGRILVDGFDVSKFGLHDLRSRLTIIPQDPVLFSGTLRFNLDPLQLHSDIEIWRTLELAHLKAHISSLPLGLDHKVSEYGENFSLGQRQLICLARAILRKSRILVLDEATASVDVETDAIVQRTIRELFGGCTIITIAHRLHTILDSDRILVLDKGSVMEIDSPGKLMSDPSSEFSALARDAGIEVASVLRHRSVNSTCC